MPLPAKMYKRIDLDRASKAMQNFLLAVGVDVEKLGLHDTPRKVAELYGELFRGLAVSTDDIWGELYATGARDPVSINGIPFYSMCEHHLLPFFGTVNIIYLPSGGRVAGFNKFTKAVSLYASRPQLQERLTENIADSVYNGLGAEGVLVSVKATQLCMRMHGKDNEGTVTTTLASKGIFERDKCSYAELARIIGETN